MWYLGDGTRAHLSRADLVRCLAQYGEAGLASLAPLLGYVYVDPDPLPEPDLPDNRANDSREDEPKSDLTESLSGDEVPSAQTLFYRVMTQHEIQPEFEKSLSYKVPTEFKKAEAITQELRADQHQTPPQPPPLAPWSRLWPFLRVALGAQRTGSSIDLEQVVMRIAFGQQLARLPYRSRPSWAMQAQVIVDLSERLLPFWQDFNALCHALLRWRGRAGLQVIVMSDGPASGVRDWHDANAPLRAYTLPPMGTSVLLLSDLGCFDQGGSARVVWQRYLSQYRSRGIMPIALMPCPPRYWYPALRQWVYPVCWD